MNASKTSWIMIWVATVILCGTRGANADFAFGEPVNLRSVIPAIDPAHEAVDCLSTDGLEMYIESDRAGGHGSWDIWVLRRTSVDEDWGPPENLGPIVNSPYYESSISISADGLTLHFMSSRPGGSGGQDIHVSTRPSKSAPWCQPVNLGPRINTAANDGGPWMSANGLELYFRSNREGGCGGYDIYVARRTTANDAWDDPVNLGSAVNSAYDDMIQSLSPDGRVLFFCERAGTTAARPGGHGGSDMWMTRRENLSGPWQTPVNLGPNVNSSADEVLCRIAPDGSMLYFLTLAGGSWKNWQAPILPIVDFNGDGKADGEDVAILTEHWGESDSVCDIAPYAWGDGMVDEQDRLALAEYLEKKVLHPAQVAHPPLSGELLRVPEAYPTIQAALGVCQPGDAIQLAPGTYRESVQIGSDISLVSIEPNDPNVTLETILLGDATQPVITLDRVGSACRVQGLTITGGSTGIACNGGMPDIIGCRIVSNQGNGIEISGEAYPTVSHCILAGNSGFGVFITDRDTSGGDAAYLPTIQNCTIAQNMAGGLKGESCEVTNSIIYFNGSDADTPQIIGDKVAVSYSCVQGSTGGLGVIGADPCFATLDSWADIDSLPDDGTAWIRGDYHLLSESGRWDIDTQRWVYDDCTSPCINWGDRSYAVDWEPLPHGGRVNIGAYGGTKQASKGDEFSLVLNIPDRPHAPERPPEGWCGETCIQMASLFYGAYIPQAVINALPNPSHPDLYSNDLPVALDKTGLAFFGFQNTSTITVDDYIEWLKTQLDWGWPVIIGCKIHPTAHPEWSLDHFMLAVGYTHHGVIYNTTWDYQEEKSYEDLSSMEVTGFSFANLFNRYYGLAVQGFWPAFAGSPLRAYPSQGNSDDYYDIQVWGLEKGERYALLRFDDIEEAQEPNMLENGVPLDVLRAEGNTWSTSVRVKPKDISIFKCVPVPEDLQVEIPEPGLIAHWALDETEGDVAHESIQGNDGFGASDLLWRPHEGRVGGALELDGIDDSVCTTFSLNPAQTSFSAFAWIKRGGPAQVVLSQTGGMDWLSADPGGQLMTALRRGSYSPNLASEFVITDGAWHHIGVVWDGSHRHLYADGTRVAEDTSNIGSVSYTHLRAHET